MLGLIIGATLQAAQPPAIPGGEAPPQIVNPQQMLQNDDYPIEALKRDQGGIVSIALHVAADGAKASCAVTETSGFGILDKATCTLFMKRARFAPARNSAGQAVEGDYHTAFIWSANGRNPTTTLRTSLQVSKLPADYRSPVEALLVFDGTGHVGSCQVTQTSGSGAADRSVCDYAKQRLTMPAPSSADAGVPAAAVRHIVATLSASPPPASDAR